MSQKRMTDTRSHCVVVYTFHKKKRFSITSTDASGERIKRKNKSMKNEGWDVQLLATGLEPDAADTMKTAIRKAYEQAGYKYQAVGSWTNGKYLDGLVDGEYQG